MSIFEPSPSPWTSRMLSVLRIVAGLIFVSAGTMKLIGFPPGPIPLQPVEPASLLGFAALLEIVGGGLITVGLFTRPVAFVLAGEMAVAYFKVHFAQSPWPTENNGMAPALYAFLFLYLSLAGPGVWSLDLLIARAKWGRRLRERARQLEKGLIPERRRVARIQLGRA